MTSKASRARLLSLVLGLSAAATSAADGPCAPLKDRIKALQPILKTEWLKIRPEQVKRAWYRRLDRVPTGCENSSGECLFLGNGNVVPGPGDRPSLGDCTESFIFNSDTKGGAMRLTGVNLEDSFPTLDGARRGATALAAVVAPPSGACPALSMPWSEPERGRECRWAADGDWVFVLSITLSRRANIWETDFSLGRMQFL